MICHDFNLINNVLASVILNNNDLFFNRSNVRSGHRILHANFSTPGNFCPHENIQASSTVVGYDDVLKQFQFNNQKQGISQQKDVY
jgi:hypothetical protein